MDVLITGAASPVGQSLVERLFASSPHRLRLTDRVPRLETRFDFRQSALGHDATTDDLVKGVDIIVHNPHPGAASPPSAAEWPPSAAEWIDAYTRCTYNLFSAAAKAGVRRVIYLSSLDLFLPYDEDMVTSENWRPRPTAEPAVMAPYLGEFIAEEFCQEGGFGLVCLRLGHLVEPREVEGQPYDPLWLDVGDAARAIAASLDADLPHFDILHLQSVSPRSRFNVEKARNALGFEPVVDFAEVAT